MNSIVIELQKDALDSSIRLSDLLRKALLVAKKLKIEEFEIWISKELNGYVSNDSIPDYRIIEGEVKVWNPYHGWQLVIFDNDITADYFSRRTTNQPIGEIEALLDSVKSKGVAPTMKFPAELEFSLMKDAGAPTPPILHVPPTRLYGCMGY